jgi:hypothetical protein
MNRLVSIIVPCYKQAHFLKESLQSVINQTYHHWECIIVNDGSPDNTKEIASQWSDKDERFKYVQKKNGGLSSARNEGIAASKGIFILPLDADDILHPDFLQETVPALINNLDIGIVACHSVFFKGTIANLVLTHVPKGNSYIYLLYVNQLLATSLYRKECWSQVGGYDETMKDGFEDWDFWLSVTKGGWDYEVIPQPLFYYRKANHSMLVETIKTNAEKVKLYLIHKHRDIYIEDFDNCIKVFTHYLVTSRKKEQRLQQSREYKLGKLIIKPFRILGILKSNK